MLTVRTASVAALSELLGRASATLSPALCRYAEEPAEEGDRARRLAGLLLLAEVYREECGDELPAIAFSERGKPYFAEGGLCFNVSHAEGLVAVALSDEPVGIDLEQVCHRPAARTERILRWMRDAERGMIASAADRDRSFTVAWVRKEAQVKKSGEGLGAMRRADATLLPRYEEFPLAPDGREYYLAVY